MIIDTAFFILLVLALFKGLRNGFVVAVFSFFAFLIGLAAALKLSAVVAGYLDSHTHIAQRWLPVLAFAIVFIAVLLLVRLAARATEGAFRMVMLGWLNKVAGVFLYALLYVFILSVVLFYAHQLHLLKTETEEGSLTYPYIRPLGPKIIAGLALVIPMFRNMFGELEQFFGNLSQ